MKKSLVALAALAVVGVASAQSSVTLFGIVDASVTGIQNKSQSALGTSFKQSKTYLNNSAYNSSRLGFRGTEDLGGGLAASFWLEGALNNDDGTAAATGGGLNFQRRSTVSLSGGFGEIRLGRDYTPTFWNDTVFDPFGTNGVGTNLISTANGWNTAGTGGGFGANPVYVRASNSVGYFLPPNLGGFYGQLMYSFNEATKYDPGTSTPAALNTQRTGRYVGGRFGYANGPLDVAVSYGSATSGDNFFGGTTDSVRTANVGASYDFGVVKLFGEASRARNQRDYENTPLFPQADIDLTGYLLGVTVPVGPGLIRAAYSQVKYDLNTTTLFGSSPDPKARKFAIGYVHNLSKRTALYATVARVNNSNGASLQVGGNGTFGTPAAAFVSGVGITPKNSTGYDIGIRHAF